MQCPYGNGKCADPGLPSECDLHGCVFSGDLEKIEFDKLQDSFVAETANGERLSFKNQNQLDFYLIDFGKTR